jgi:hypothetical protein
MRNSTRAVETIVRYLLEQELIERPVGLDELFAPSVLAT